MALPEKTRTFMISSFSVAVAILLLGYSAYGWMSMNRTVTAKGMNMTVTAPDNLEISAEGSDGLFSTSVTVNMNSVVKRDIIPGFDEENDTFSLLPASSYEGLSIWQTPRANADGTAYCAENGFLSGGPVAMSETYGTYEGYYVDVPLWFRSYSTSEMFVVLKDNLCNISVEDASNVTGIVRTAFLNPAKTAPSYTGNTGGYGNTLVFADDERDTGNVVTLNTENDLSKYIPGRYISFGADGKSEQTLFTIPPSENGIPSIVQIAVRIWIEGQDNNCIGTMVRGGKVFTIDLGFTSRDS